jgi:hypothetical protein
LKTGDELTAILMKYQMEKHFEIDLLSYLSTPLKSILADLYYDFDFTIRVAIEANTIFVSDL